MLQPAQCDGCLTTTYHMTHCQDIFKTIFTCPCCTCLVKGICRQSCTEYIKIQRIASAYEDDN